MATSRVLHSLLVGICCLASAALAQAQIFGPRTPSSPPSVQQTSANLETSQPNSTQRSWWPSIPLPKITMPKVTMPTMSTVIGPVKSGYGKVAAGTRKAWEGTKEMLTFGQARESSTSAHRAAKKKPSFWQRLVGSEPEPAGPQTVAEWMAQPRLDP